MRVKTRHWQSHTAHTQLAIRGALGDFVTVSFRILLRFQDRGYSISMNPQIPQLKWYVHFMCITLHNYICVQIGKPHISLGKSRLLLFFKSRHCLKHNCPFHHLEGISLLQLTISPQCCWQDFPFDGATWEEEWLYARIFPCHTCVT